MRAWPLVILLVSATALADEAALARLKRQLAGAQAAKGPGVVEMYRKIVRDFDGLKLPANGPEAEIAAEAAFWVAEADSAEFWKTRIKPPPPPRRRPNGLITLLCGCDDLDRQYERYTSLAQKAMATFEAIANRFDVPRWRIRAVLRVADLVAAYLAEVQRLGCPDEVLAIGGSEACAEYAIQMEEQYAPFEDKRLDAWAAALTIAEDAAISFDSEYEIALRLCTARPTIAGCER